MFVVHAFRIDQWRSIAAQTQFNCTWAVSPNCVKQSEVIPFRKAQGMLDELSQWSFRH